MPSVFLSDLDKIISDVSKYDDVDIRISEFYTSMGQTVYKNKTQLKTVVIFDLVESTLLKAKIGHAKAMREILLHDKICRTVVKRLDGNIIKETGDGLVALFENPLYACLAAINVLEIAVRKEIHTKAALVLGMLEEIKISNKIDVFGTAMDVCSRIEKHASENQILINSALHDTVQTFLKDYDDVLISKPIHVTLKGYGKSEIYEISSKNIGLKNYVTPLLQNNEHERLTIDEKIELIHNAESDIIEVGSGFLDFVTHFGNSTEFVGFIKKLLKKGINIKFIVIDPDWSSEKLKTVDETEWENSTSLKNHFTILKELQNELNAEKLPGGLEVSLYKKIPLFSALCIDSNREGRMIVSNRLHGIEKSENPEIQFSKKSDPLMFNSYMSSIQFLLKNSQLQ